ncbi:MAG TPA: amidase family protein, partial [Solirubrobacterales bacterium]|nr:amidase family protein [Solirubrobacterales bacterium]
MGELLQLSVAEAAARIAAGDLSATEYFEAWQAAAAGDELNAYLCAVDGAAHEAGSGPLGGIPVAVKDIFCTEGTPTTAGSRILEGYEPPYTATAVRKLDAAGARVLGKTNMDEFAMGSSTEHSGYGPTHNPWDVERIPGGSGGGSSAAVSAFEAPLAIGTDTGGSIRQPGAVTGTVGVKPTYGGVSRYGLIALASSLDQAGPCTRTVLDAALLHEVIGGHDPLDSTSIDQPLPPVVEAARRGDVRGMRIGLVKELGGE